MFQNKLFYKLFCIHNIGFMLRLIYYLIYLSGGKMLIDPDKVNSFNYLIRTEEVDGKLFIEVEQDHEN